MCKKALCYIRLLIRRFAQFLATVAEMPLKAGQHKFVGLPVGKEGMTQFMKRVAEIHAAERVFFDTQARSREARLVDRAILHRYSAPGSLLPRDMMFRIAGDLSGKHVLEVGCGEGDNAVLLTKLGAKVTAFDISEGAIDLAHRRFAANQCVPGTLFASSLETVELGRYDLVWVESLLHHMLHDFEAVLAKLSRAVKPGGMIVMKEPVNLWSSLRNLRISVGPETEHTPDERPLESKDIVAIRRHFPHLHIQYFRCLGRLNRFVLPNSQLESAPLGRKAAVYGLAAIDQMLFSIPGMKRTAGIAVMWSRG
jgi:2-polyprenyl-3-methyl-5-hydroxy-6-metoxy-1,4-benzoquinol methylase